VKIDPEDIRRACEVQAKSHLIHLREAFLETHAETTRIARLITASAAPLRALLTHIARLPDARDLSAAESHSKASATTASLSDESLATMAERRMGVPAAVIRDVLASSANGHSSVTDPSHLLAGYIDESWTGVFARCREQRVTSSLWRRCRPTSHTAALTSTPSRCSRTADVGSVRRAKTTAC
jgi:hypothetical protein